ncbi:helix-turn-helix domain-containing protein [Pseudoalteromonas rubra]|uniref:helix-turn-helix domain-containing protein n=1 Tax=Pseudoalteromonas rubra TaxID=43658 RepID=UPI000F7A0A8F|nr:helix-turn-helix domain-containing protein [Pseudoalteromonas rubra]
MAAKLSSTHPSVLRAVHMVQSQQLTIHEAASQFALSQRTLYRALRDKQARTQSHYSQLLQQKQQLESQLRQIREELACIHKDSYATHN